MTTGVIASYDPEEETGFIKPDQSDWDDLIPFDADTVTDLTEGPMLREGQRVYFEASGGLAGIAATVVRRV